MIGRKVVGEVRVFGKERGKKRVEKKITNLGPYLKNLSCVAELSTAGSNLNRRFKVKDEGRI